MPVHLKILICTLIFSDKTLLAPQDDSQGQYICVPKLSLELEHQNGRYGKKSICLILYVVVIVLDLHFESQYLKNCKRYRSEILQTSSGQ